MRREFFFAAFLFLFVMGLVFPRVVGRWVRHELENRMKTKIEGVFSPAFFVASFRLRDARFVWPGRVKLISGDLKIDYDPFSFLRGESLRIKISSQNLSVKLLGKWAEAEGIEDVKFEHFFADLGMGREGLEEVFGIEAQSPMMELRYQNAKTS